MFYDFQFNNIGNLGLGSLGTQARTFFPYLDNAFRYNYRPNIFPRNNIRYLDASDDVYTINNNPRNIAYNDRFKNIFSIVNTAREKNLAYDFLQSNADYQSFGDSLTRNTQSIFNQLFLNYSNSADNPMVRVLNSDNPKQELEWMLFAEAKRTLTAGEILGADIAPLYDADDSIKMPVALIEADDFIKKLEDNNFLKDLLENKIVTKEEVMNVSVQTGQDKAELNPQGLHQLITYKLKQDLALLDEKFRDGYRDSNGEISYEKLYHKYGGLIGESVKIPKLNISNEELANQIDLFSSNVTNLESFLTDGLQRGYFQIGDSGLPSWYNAWRNI